MKWSVCIGKCLLIPVISMCVSCSPGGRSEVPSECRAPEPISNAVFEVVSIARERSMVEVRWQMEGRDKKFLLSYGNCPDDPEIVCDFDVGYIDGSSGIISNYANDGRIPKIRACNDCGCSDWTVAKLDE